MHLATYLSEVNTLVLGRLVFYLVFFPYSVVGWLHSNTKVPEMLKSTSFLLLKERALRLIFYHVKNPIVSDLGCQIEIKA